MTNNDGWKYYDTFSETWRWADVRPIRQTGVTLIRPCSLREFQRDHLNGKLCNPPTKEVNLTTKGLQNEYRRSNTRTN